MSTLHLISLLNCQPCGSDQAGEQSSLLGVCEPHDSWSLDFLPNPLTLAHVVNEHELNPDVATVRHLEKRNKQDGQRDAGRQMQTQEHKQNTSSLRMISRRGRVVSPPPMKEVGGSWKLRSKSDSSRP